MQTTKTYVRKVFTGHNFIGGPLVTHTFMYRYPEGLVQLALDHGTQKDEGYELVTEKVSAITSDELDAMVTDGLGQHMAARLAAGRAEDEREYARLAAKLGKSQ